MKFKIKHRWTVSVLFEIETDSLKAAVEAAVKAGADLRGANFTGAYLRGADLTRAYLRGANLTGAYLTGADLTGAYLTGADLTGADFTRANLKKGTTKINWLSHDLVAEILRRAAGCDIEKLKIAGFILVCRNWCWKDFTQIDDPLKTWAIGVLQEWVSDDADDAPGVLNP